MKKILFKWIGIIGLGCALILLFCSMLFQEPTEIFLCIITAFSIAQFSLLSFVVYFLATKSTNL